MRFRLRFNQRRLASLGCLTSDFLNNLFDIYRVQVGFKTSQGYADHVTVMEFVPQSLARELEPQSVEQFDVLGPEPRRMRAEVEIGLSVGFLVQNLKGELRSWLFQALPGIAECLGLFGGGHPCRQSHHAAG